MNAWVCGRDGEDGMKTEGRIRMLTACLPAGMVLALSVLFLIRDKQDFSENENRYLAEFPEFGWRQVREGTYMDGLTDYVSDHFPFRDFWIGMKTKAELISGKKEINGIFIAEDGYLIEAYEKPENTDRIAGIWKNFAETVNGMERENGIEMRLMLVPTAVTVYEEKLPAHAPLNDQMETAEYLYAETGIRPVDCSGLLMESREDGNLYYRTDHHWTTLGAYEGYRAFCGEMGFTPVPLEEMTAQTVTEDFRGTLYSKAGDYGRMGDEIVIYTNPDDRLQVEYRDNGEVTDSLYNLEYVEKKDKYSLFLNNLHPLIEITNEAAQTGRELVLIKDSYANSMVPFLVHHYKKIYVFDTRYYKDGPSAFIAEHEGVTEVLLLYNMNTLDGDLGVRGVY